MVRATALVVPEIITAAAEASNERREKPRLMFDIDVSPCSAAG
jgi:hypothetical protein